MLVVEDDPVIAGAVCERLESWGLETRRARDYGAVMEEFAAFGPQLVLLDVSLPRYSGYHWCAEIRKVSKVPVMFISSAAENMNIVMAMNMGADDFVAKRLLDCGGGALLDPASGTVTAGGVRLELTKNELRILQALAEKRGSVVTREELMLRLWQTDSFVDENTLTVNVTRLRRRLAELGLGELIKTRKGLGYIID